jgi:branched-chain amino acid transport system permease protein
MTRKVWAVLFLGLIVFPFLSKGSGPEFASDIMIFAILAIGLYVQIGLIGMVNFGFSAFFGLGAYIGAITMMKVSTTLLVSLPITMGAVMLVAAAFGALAIRTRETAFSILTLTFSQLLYVLAVADEKWTHGVNGLTGVPRPTLPAWLSESTGLNFDNDRGLYLLVLGMLIAVAVLVQVLRRSRLGAVLEGIRENEERMEVLGYSVRRYKLVAFVMSASIGAVAGYLNAALLGYAGPTSLFWTVSGETILMVTLGGATTILGPIVGAIVFVGLSHFAVEFTDHWRLYVGITFIGVILFAPKGIVPIVQEKLGRYFPGRGTVQKSGGHT